MTTKSYCNDVGLTEANFQSLLARNAYDEVYALLDRARFARRWDEHLEDLAAARPTWFDNR